MFRSILVGVALCLLAACSGDAQDDTPPATSAPRPTVLDDQLKALEKAKAVGQQLQEEKERTDQAIEDQGG